MKKILLLAIIFLNLSVLPSFAAEQKVVIDRLTQSEAEDLDIQIPDDVPPGYHSITIEVYDDNGTVSQKDIEFCKDENGVVQWDNNCPNLKVDEEGDFIEPEPVEEVKSDLKPYNPLKDSDTTTMAAKIQIKETMFGGFAGENEPDAKANDPRTKYLVIL